MARFQFRLNAVFEIRKKREDDALRALAAGQRALQAELDGKSALLGDLDRALTDRERLGSGGAPLPSIAVTQDFILGTKHRLLQADVMISRARRAVEKAMHAFLIARRQTRAIEVLHDRALAEFKKAQADRERKEMDDLSIMRARFREGVLE